MKAVGPIHQIFMPICFYLSQLLVFVDISVPYITTINWFVHSIYHNNYFNCRMSFSVEQQTSSHKRKIYIILNKIQLLKMTWCFLCNTETCDTNFVFFSWHHSLLWWNPLVPMMTKLSSWHIVHPYRLYMGYFFKFKFELYSTFVISVVCAICRA